MRMKCNRHTIKLTLAFFAMFALAACVNTLDEEDFKTTFRVEGGEECALFFKIETGEDDMDTRASGDLVNGSVDEHKIGETGNYAFFFKTDGSLYRTEELTLYDAADNDCGEVTDNTPSTGKHKVEKIYRTRLDLRDSDGEIEKELQCLVVLNGDPIFGELEDLKTLDEFLEFSWTCNGDPMTGIGRDGDLFTMTNSSYVDDGEVFCAVPIDVEKLYTPLEVDGVDPQKIVTIHVERMLAKFTFEVEVNDTEIDGPGFKKFMDGDGKILYYEITPTNNIITYCSGIDSDNEDSPILEEVKFKIRVTGWGINALERKSNAYKKINTTTYFTNWNDAENYRSYWAEDAHYGALDLFQRLDDTNDAEDQNNAGNHYDPRFYTSYPWQFRRSVNNGVSFDYYDKHIDATNGNLNGNYLWNYSFTDLNNSKFDKLIYVPENTYDAEEVRMWGHDNRENVLAGTHLIIGAELLTDLDGDGIYEPNELWRDRTGVYYSDSTFCFWSLVRSFNLALQSHVYMDYTRFKWKEDDGIDIAPRSALTMSGNFLRELDEFDKKEGENWNGYKEHQGSKYYLCFNDDKYSDADSKKRTQIDEYSVVKSYEGNLFRPAIVTGGDGQVLPWPDPSNDYCMTIRGEDGSPLDIYESISIEYSEDRDNGQGGMRIVTGVRAKTQVDARDIKSMLYEWTGAVDHFKDGKMYYAAPAELTGAGGAASIYGVVRNGWYKYKLSDIQVIGTSVDNVDEPIVPNKVITHDQLNITVDIIDWHNFLNIVAPVL